MAADEQLRFTCRRTRRCRAKLPADSLYRDPASGELYCKPGHCPNHKGDQHENLIQLQLENRRLREQLRTQTNDQDRLLGKVEQLQDSLHVALDIREIDAQQELEPITSHPDRSETIPLLLCSDWHCGAIVDPATVCGLNQYDVEIFHERAAALFRNTLRVVRMLRSTTEVSKCVIWLGGDLIDNWLHPDQVETQVLSPTQQLIECERAIVAGLDYLLEHGDFERIIVPCSFGNHGRTTDKMRAGNAAATSYEWLMYKSLARHYKHEDRLVFDISDGNIHYVNVLGHRLRFHHGDAIRYGGGVGGITIPLQKWIYRQDQGIKADHTFMGHFHQLTMGQNWSVNGSLIGATPYGMKLGFAPERPQQLLRCIDSERGFTISAPILTD
jgi:hypothetical protein